MSRAAAIALAIVVLPGSAGADEPGGAAEPAGRPTSDVVPAFPSSPQLDFDFFSKKSGVGTMGLVAFRISSTVVEGQNGVDREVEAVGAQIGGRLRGLGTLEFITARVEAEGFAGGGRDGIDASGHAVLAFGVATHLADKDALLFRLGAGGRAFGNAAFDFETIEAPLLDLAFQHHGDDWFLDVGPTGGLALATHAGAGASAERSYGLAGLGGLRGLFGIDPFWASLEYAALVEEDVAHLVGGSFCIVPDGISGCLDARYVGVNAFAGTARHEYSVRAAYVGLAIGLGTGFIGN